ncbi:uncharacterized protein MELLADRAFT_108249 [Melampsora larici-populina 98AG31]|uniref:Arrestin C-terminal-like domain-containing protein n=1 Tax=Melampsora larici-populina (strain 98AG31 / pathotype 3-4-7) TaxID=747676 RepID=F4RSG7_MELLP|nr:uncharacterized protein MELLADRAFT_108249 [Melampsora larici-populina 98AG31]EGG04694.1 hypothetical protein MELLADRAFT_108249 [Melampsora larici-populina 98AG31]
MVEISLIPRRGKCATFFPHAGYLGISPVFVEGQIRAHEHPQEKEVVKALQISIRLRCYEEAGLLNHISPQRQETSSIHPTDRSRSKTTPVLWETSEVVWRASQADSMGCGSSDYIKVGDFEAKWKLVIPASPSIAGAMTFKDWRTWWQVEAVIQRPHPHPPITKSYPLNIRNFRCPQVPKTLICLDEVVKDLPMVYSISTPAHVSCGDTITIPIVVSPISKHHSFAIKAIKGTVTLERIITIRTESESPQRPRLRPSASMWDLPTRRSRSSLDAGPTPIQSSLRPSDRPSTGLISPSKSSHYKQSTTIDRIQTAVAHFPILQQHELQPVGLSTTVTMNIPRPKSNHHYSIGDSCNTKLATETDAYSPIQTIQLVVKTPQGGKYTTKITTRDVEFTGVPLIERLAAFDHIVRLRQKKACQTKTSRPENRCHEALMIANA